MDNTELLRRVRSYAPSELPGDLIVMLTNALAEATLSAENWKGQWLKVDQLVRDVTAERDALRDALIAAEQAAYSFQVLDNYRAIRRRVIGTEGSE